MKKCCINRNQQGMTLIEIMVAMVLGIFLLGGIMQIFLASKQTYRMQENLSRMQENGRFAMGFLTKDIRMADYMGCLRTGLGNMTNKLDSTDADYDVTLHSFTGLNGIGGTNGAAGANLALDSPDSIILKGAYDVGIRVVEPYMINTAANIKVSTSDGLALYDIVLVSDCSSSDVFEITTDPTTGAGAEVVVHNGGNVAEGPGNSDQLLSKTYKGDASIFKFQTYIYTVQNNALTKQDLSETNELVEGIANMQILYGSDTSGDSTADHYVTANLVPDMSQVVSIRVSLLVVSTDDNLTSEPRAYTYNGVTTTPADRRLRRVFSSTIAIRNRLP